MQRPQADEKNEAGIIRGKSALHQVLEAVVKIEKGKVITGPADSVGLLLYNINVRTPSNMTCKGADGSPIKFHRLLRGITNPVLSFTNLFKRSMPRRSRKSSN
jgi:hypothetical protein